MNNNKNIYLLLHNLEYKIEKIEKILDEYHKINVHNISYCKLCKKIFDYNHSKMCRYCSECGVLMHYCNTCCPFYNKDKMIYCCSLDCYNK